MITENTTLSQLAIELVKYGLTAQAGLRDRKVDGVELARFRVFLVDQAGISAVGDGEHLHEAVEQALTRYREAAQIPQFSVTCYPREIVYAPTKAYPPTPPPSHPCKVCGADYNAEGERVHGKGCYELSEEGGGTDYAWEDPQ